MRTLSIAFAMAMACCLTLYFLVSAIVAEREVAIGVATLPFVSVSHVYETLERAGVRRAQAAGTSEAVASFQDFGLPWVLVVLCGALMVIGIMNLAVLGAEALAAVSSAEGTVFPTAKSMMPFDLPFAVVGSYLLGRWIGGRCRSHGVLALLAACVFGATLGKAIDFLALSMSDLRDVYGEDGLVAGAGTFADFFAQAALGAMLYSVVGGIGYWRGRRNRQSKYLRYLLTALPRETRDTLLGMAYEEARSTTRLPRPGA